MLNKIYGLILIITLIFSLTVLYSPKVYASGENWLSGFNYRVSFTISSSDVDSDLTYFPVLVHLSSSCGKNNEDLSFVFDEVGASYYKIAFTKSDGDTQLYGEVERWNSTTEQAYITVSLSGWIISSSSDTVFYLYYDSSATNNTSYIGTQASLVAQNVWNSSYKISLQLSDNNLDDSTNNNNDGTDNSSSDYINSIIAGAREFDGDNEYVSYSTSNVLDGFTFDFWIKITSDDGNNGGGFMGRMQYSARHNALGVDWSFLYTGVSGIWRLRMVIGGTNYNLDSSTNPTIGDWYHITITRSGVNGIMYNNASSIGSSSSLGSGNLDNDWNLFLGVNYGGGDYYCSESIIDRFIISNEVKNSTWINVNNLSGWDNLLDGGSEEESSEDKVYVTFQLNTGGLFYVNGTSKTNGTETEYDNLTVLLLVGAPSNSNYTFTSFNYTSGYNFTNSLELIIGQNETIWCYFGNCSGSGGYTETDLEEYLAIGGILAFIFVISFTVIIIDKKEYFRR